MQGWSELLCYRKFNFSYVLFVHFISNQHRNTWKLIFVYYFIWSWKIKKSLPTIFMWGNSTICDIVFFWDRIFLPILFPSVYEKWMYIKTTLWDTDWISQTCNGNYHVASDKTGSFLLILDEIQNYLNSKATGLLPSPPYLLPPSLDWIII